MFGLAALVGAGSSVLGGILQNKATKKANAANQANVERGIGFVKEYVGKGEAANQQAVQAAEQGFAEATKSIGIIGQAARRRLLRREKARLGAADANAADRGLYHSTGALGARRAVQSETDLSLASIDEALAGLHSQIYRDRGTTLASIHNARTALYGLYGQAAGMTSGLATSITHQAAPIGASIGAAGGSIAQMLMAYGMMDKLGGKFGDKGVF